MKKNDDAKALVLAMISILSMGLGFATQADPQASAFKVLAIYDASSGDAAHDAYTREANTWFPSVAAANGFTYESTTDWSKLNTSNLANYKVLMFLNDMCWDNNQRTAFQTYMTNGGGWIGFHSCAFNNNSDSKANWDWYTITFLGMGYFASNTWWPTTAILDVEDTTHAVTKGFPKTFVSPVNEFYAWANDLRQNSNIKVLCSIDSKSFPLGTDPNQSWYSGYYPVIWTNKNFKMVYSNFGHEYMNYSTNTALSQTFTDTQYCRLILNAVKYCAGMTTNIDGGRQALEQTAPNAGDLTVTTGAKFLTVSIAGAAKVRAELKDANGRVVARSNGDAGPCMMDRSELSTGVYFLRVTGEHRTILRKIFLP